MGGAGVRDLRRHDRRRGRVGHLRPGEHPPHGLPLRAPLARPACGSRRARSIVWPAWERIARRGSSPSGRAARSPTGVVDTAPQAPPPARVAFRPGRDQPAAGHGPSDRRAARPPRPGRHRHRAGAGGDAGHGRGGDEAAGGRGGRRRDRPRHGPDLAARPAHRGRRRRGGGPGPWLRRRARPPARTPRCRPTGPHRCASATSFARPWPPPACRRPSPRPSSRRRWPSASGRSTIRPYRGRGGRRTRHPRRQPALQPALGHAPEPASAASWRSWPRTADRAARTSPCSRSARGMARSTRIARTSGGASASR